MDIPPDAPAVASLREALGHVVREFRTEAGYSQEAFADAVGVHRTFAGTIERGESNLSLESIERVAVALGVLPSHLFLAAEQLFARAAAAGGGRGVPGPDGVGSDGVGSDGVGSDGVGTAGPGDPPGGTGPARPRARRPVNR